MTKKSDPPIRVANRDTREWTPFGSYTTSGFWDDGWVGMTGSMEISPPVGTRCLRIVGNKLHNPEHLRVLAKVGTVVVRRELLAVGHFILDLPYRLGSGTIEVAFEASASYVPAEVGINGDDSRSLSWILVAVEASK